MFCANAKEEQLSSENYAVTLQGIIWPPSTMGTDTSSPFPASITVALGTEEEVESAFSPIYSIMACEDNNEKNLQKLLNLMMQIELVELHHIV